MSGRLARTTVLAAIVGSNGNYALVAMRLRRSVAQVKKIIERDPILFTAMKEEENTILDYAEGVLMGHLAKGNLSAAMYVLNTRGREKGWGQGNSVTVRADSDVPLGIVVMPAPPRSDTPDPSPGSGSEEPQ